MKNELLAVTHRGHDVLIGLKLDKDKMDVRFLNQELRDEFKVDGFTVDPYWELRMETARHNVNATAVTNFFISVLEQRQELILSFDDLR